MRRALPRGFCTISSICGRQNFTWSFLTSSISRYFRTWVEGGRQVRIPSTCHAMGMPALRTRSWGRTATGMPAPGMSALQPTMGEKNRTHLVEDESLADIAPGAAG